MATITLADLLDRTRDADDNDQVFVDMGGRYVSIADVQAEGNQIVIVLDEDDL